jgi:hypothetical protein
VPKERLLLITNVTTNTVIYNFSDPSLTATTYTLGPNTNATNATTTLILNYNTTSMTSTDKLSIVVDEPAELFAPDEAYMDPVGKFRVSTPQALIDTDFEYGLQPTKWETLTLINNRPSFFVNTQTPITVSNITIIGGTSTVNVITTSPPAVGTPIMLQDTLFGPANGPFIVDNVFPAGVAFQVNAKSSYTLVASGTIAPIYNSALTTAFAGNLYTAAQYIHTQPPQYSNVMVNVYTNEPHGLQVGDGVYLTGSNVGSLNSSYSVASVPTANVFQVVTTTIQTAQSSGAGNSIPRPDGVYLHRAFDGGVQFSTGNPAHNIQTIRQTRRYFRYQSGKGIQISTGTILKPNINVDDVSANGTTITVTTKALHYLQGGATVTVSGANETAYNGTWTVDQVIDGYRFTYISGTAPSATPASGIIAVSVTGWYGATTRLGMYDSQNGVFFEFDGQTLWAVRRRSTDQLAGFVNVTQGNAYVYGATVQATSTKFSKQLTPGDFVVIRGATYRVMDIFSDTLMTITPPYRGSTLAGQNTAIVSKTTDIRVPQNLWNIDKCDGTGPSGVTLDLSKMQMFYLDYSWYGAGTIRYGFRNTKGDVFYCHRFVNVNQNTEAYMRSGNLPGRYETNTFSLKTNLVANLGIGATSMTLGNVAGWPTSGTVLVADPALPAQSTGPIGSYTGGFEYINYTGLFTSNNTLVGLTRAPNLVMNTATVTGFAMTANSANITTTSTITGILQPGQFIWGQNIPNGTYINNIYPGATNTIKLSQAATATASTITLNVQGMAANTSAHNILPQSQIGVYLHAPQFSPTVSHWGTSVIMDGRFDDDKSLIFLYGETTFSNVAPGTSVALMTLRASPSVDSGVPGVFGLKEIVNRMQLKLQQVEVLSGGQFLIQLVLNANLVVGTSNTSGTPTIGTYARIATGTSSLAQIADHTANVAPTGGENIFGFYAVNTAGAGQFSIYTQDLTLLRDLGNGILGGGLTNNPQLNIYPDGPDTVTIVAQNIGTAYGNISSRLGWTEAQA